MMRLAALCVCMCAATAPAWALDLTLPSNARLTAERDSKLDSYALPLAPFGVMGIPVVQVEGKIRRSAWRIASPGLTPLQVLGPLRDQVVNAGYSIDLDCDQTSCGGFDFRFATEVLPAPNMYVNIRAYRFLSAHRGPVSAPEDVISLMVSASDTVAYVQIIRAGTLADENDVQTSGDVPLAEDAERTVISRASGIDSLIADGSVTLSELDFETGTSDLGAGPFPVLASIAALLAERDDIRIALVGHTDSVGGLQSNIALSKRRAQSVRQRLITTYNVDPARLDAEGMGYLSPAASHLTAEGREANRRVVAVVLPAG